MKAWLVHAPHDMRLTEVAEPPPPRPGWVNVAIRVAQPSITEVLLFHGEHTYGHAKIAAALARGPAQVFGHEFSGEVVALGAGVDSLAVGDRVAPRGSHPEGIVGFDYPGAFAEIATFPASLLARLPPHVSDSEGAAIQPLTDAVAAVHAAGIRGGETVAVIGLGSMGFGCLQAARAAGAGRIVAIARRPQSLALARTLGADEAVANEGNAAVERVLELTGGQGADIVFETAGGPPERGLGGDATLVQAAQMCRPGGRVVGVAFNGDAAVLPYAPFRTRGIGFLFPAPLDRALLEATVDLVASGKVRLQPLITHVLEGIEALPRAIELTGDKARHGLVNPAQIVISRGTSA